MFNRADATSQSTKQSRSRIVDPEFGEIICRRSSQARFVRIRVGEDGTVRASLPKRAPLYMVSELLENSRGDIRKLVAAQKSKLTRYRSDMTIGHSHRLEIVTEDVPEPKTSFRGQIISISLPVATSIDSEVTQAYISKQVRKALRREAVAYLPRRLRYLAEQFGFDYTKERFGNQSGRWASCSSSGTISLNVALMNLPHELIDYVLIHELAHTKQMNHSPSFWSLVESCMPEYKSRRKLLKSMSPIC